MAKVEEIDGVLNIMLADENKIVIKTKDNNYIVVKLVNGVFVVQ